MIEIKISRDFSDTPGGRYIKEGPNSGEEFRKKLLLPKYNEAICMKERLLIDLDDCYGYATSFLEEAFGGLARELGNKDILQIIDFKSEDEPGLIELIHEYVSEVEI